MAHENYRAKRFSLARQAYESIVARWPEDGVSKTMMDRARDLDLDPPPANWSGIHRPKSK
jgi:hypothetical protein